MDSTSQSKQWPLSITDIRTFSLIVLLHDDHDVANERLNRVHWPEQGKQGKLGNTKKSILLYIMTQT